VREEFFSGKSSVKYMLLVDLLLLLLSLFYINLELMNFVKV